MTWYHPALAPRTIIALDDEIAKLRAENERLRAEVEYLGRQRDEWRERALNRLNQQCPQEPK